MELLELFGELNFLRKVHEVFILAGWKGCLPLCSDTSPCGSHYDCQTRLSNHHQETLKTRFITHQSWRGYNVPRDHKAKSQGEAECKRAALTFIGGEG